MLHKLFLLDKDVGFVAQTLTNCNVLLQNQTGLKSIVLVNFTLKTLNCFQSNIFLDCTLYLNFEPTINIFG